LSSRAQGVNGGFPLGDVPSDVLVSARSLLRQSPRLCLEFKDHVGDRYDIPRMLSQPYWCWCDQLS
jgi:hypothetical protein